MPIADACCGANQINSTLDAFLGPSASDALPSRPEPLRKAGREVFLVSRQSGTIASTNSDAACRLPSFAKLELAVQPGSVLAPTTDSFTRPGSVQLIHADPAQVARDYVAISHLEEASELFILSQ